MRMKKGDNFELNVDGDIYLCSLQSSSPFSYEILKVINENHEINGYIRLLYKSELYYLFRLVLYFHRMYLAAD